jgi:hypothetical protein
MKLLVLSGMVLAFLQPFSCDDGKEFDEFWDRARLENLRAEIEEMIGDAACLEGADCRYIAFGAKPCGGPWEYKIYSVTNVDTVKLQEVVAEYNSFNAHLNRKYGWISTCDIPSVPRVGCRDGRCVAMED